MTPDDDTEISAVNDSDAESRSNLSPSHIELSADSSEEITRFLVETVGGDRQLLDSDVDELISSSDDDMLVSHFLLRRRLGRGGFGSVYLADDTRLNRQVAVKIAHRVSAGDAATFYSRVMREGRAAARLDHPHIVPIYEVAEHKNRPLIVGKYIEGVTLAERIKSGRFTADGAAKLCAQIADAVGYANRKGIVHRDLKPGNILLDANGQPYVTDFGLAKYESVEETISGDSGYIGTPAYMSPEQAAGLSHTVDGRGDLYAIGVILFELLTGERPFRGNAKMLMHQVIFDEAPSPRKLVHTIPRDLETICLKCLHKDRERRYQTCEEVAEELGRFLNKQPILARPVSRAERAIRWCYRHQLVTSLATAFLLSLVLGLVGVSWQWFRAERFGSNERLARIEAGRANEQLAAQILETQRMLYNSRLSLAEQAVEAGHYQQIESLLSPFQDSAFKNFDFDFEYYHFRQLHRLLKKRLDHVEVVNDIRFHPNNRMLAVAGTRTTMVFDIHTGALISSIRGHREKVQRAKFVPGTDLVATASDDGFVRFWSFETGEASEPPLNTGAPVRDIEFHGASGRVAVAQASGQVTIWDVRERELIRSVDAHTKPVTAVRFMKSGTQIVTGSEDETVGVWNVETGELVKKLPSLPTSIAALDVHDAEGWVGVGYMTGQVRVYSADGSVVSTIRNTLAGPIGRLTCMDQDAYAISGLIGEVQVRDRSTGQLRFKMQTHHETFGIHAVSRDSGVFAAGGDDGIVKVFDINLQQHRNATQVGNGEIAMLQFIGASPRWIGLGDDGAISLAVADHLTNPESLTASPAEFSAVSVGVDSQRICVGCADGQVGFFDLDSRQWCERVATNHGAVTAVSVLMDDSLVAVGSDDGSICLWNRGDDACGNVIHTHRGGLRELVTTSDGKHLYSVGLDGVVFHYDANTKLGNEFSSAGEPIHSLAVSRDNTELAVGLGNGVIERWRLSDRKSLGSLYGHIGPVQAVLYLPSNQTIVSGANDRQVRLWDLKTGETKIKFTAHNRAIRRMAMSHDGSVLLTGDAGGLVLQWDAPRQ